MTYFKPHTWNVLCDVCGFKFKSDQLKKRWDGFMVCDRDWEMRHPQDLIKVPRETPAPSWTRPESDDGTWGGCTLDNAIAIPNIAVAGCAVTARYNKWGDY